MIKLQNFPNSYRLVYRVINPSVLDQLQKTREAKLEYDRLMSQRLGVQVTFGMMYALGLRLPAGSDLGGLVVFRQDRGARGAVA